MEKINRLIFSFLLAAIVCSTGCSTIGFYPTEIFARHSDPIAGWRVADLANLDANKTISDDYRSYVRTLSSKEQKYADSVFYFEDGTGQRAVKIKISLDGTWWEHVLIYNKDNKRIKVIKYIYGHYDC